MSLFLKSSPKTNQEIQKISPKVVLVCRALVKVIAHKELVSVKSEYPYLGELD